MRLSPCNVRAIKRRVDVRITDFCAAHARTGFIIIIGVIILFSFIVCVGVCGLAVGRIGA